LSLSAASVRAVAIEQAALVSELNILFTTAANQARAFEKTHFITIIIKNNLQ
jgi:hypothetical protein